MARLVIVLCVVGILHSLTRTGEGIPMNSNTGVLSHDGYKLPFQRLTNGRATRYVPGPSCQPLGRKCGSGRLCCGHLDCMTDFKEYDGVCW